MKSKRDVKSKRDMYLERTRAVIALETYDRVVGELRAKYGGDPAFPFMRLGAAVSTVEQLAEIFGVTLKERGK